MNRSSFKHLFGGLGLGLALLGTTVKAGDKGFVYSMDNVASANHVLIFQREQNGQITSAGSVATGGAGNGANLGLPSQGSVLLSHDGRWLFVCNAGSDDISVFATTSEGLQLVDKVNSGGHLPVSLALHHNLLYVVNAGGNEGDQDNITAFLFVDGKLIALPGSTRALSGDATGPAQVSFTGDGDTLIVTERLTGLMDTFSLNDDGLATTHQIFTSPGITPFGFAVGRGDDVFISDANAGVANGSSASSFRISDSGYLDVITSALPTEQGGSCWLALAPNERYVYTANAASGSLSGLSVSQNGELKLLDPSGVTAVIAAGSHPVDLATSADGRVLFSLANGNGTLNAFEINEDVSLRSLGVASGIPESAAGLAVR